MHLAKDNELDQALYLWFVQKCSIGMPMSGPILCERLSKQVRQLYHHSQQVLIGISGLCLQGEKLSADTEVHDPFKKQLQDVMGREGLTLEQIYNCDETGLYYRMLPTRTLATKTNKQNALQIDSTVTSYTISEIAFDSKVC